MPDNTVNGGAFTLSGEDMISILKGETLLNIEPKDAEIVQVSQVPDTPGTLKGIGRFIVILHHPDFYAVSEGNQYPQVFPERRGSVLFIDGKFLKPGGPF